MSKLVAMRLEPRSAIRDVSVRMMSNQNELKDTLNQHPTKEQLFSFSRGSYPDDSLLWVADHVACCPTCMTILESSPKDTLVDLLRTTVDSPNPILRWKQGYRIEREMGRGGMGVVYLAEEQELHRKVALKMLATNSYSDPTYLSRFRREAKAAAALTHPCIAQIFDVGEQDGKPYIAMEWVQGPTLAKHLSNGLLPFRVAVDLMIQLTDAMSHAHARGIIHRDLKPSNILIEQPNENRLHPKIVDFGLAKQIQSDESATASGILMGTPRYMSPEQATAEKSIVDSKSDIYSLGVILYQCITGRCPFEGTSSIEILEQVRNAEPTPPRLLRLSVPKDLETICLKCLEKKPEARYGSADELGDDLKRFRDGLPVHAKPHGILVQLYKVARRYPAFATLIACTLFGAIALLGLSLSFNQSLSLALREQQAESLRANQNLELALEAIDKTLEQVGFEQLANQPGMEKVREELLSKAVHLYSSLLASHTPSAMALRAPENDLEATAMRQYANALSKLGRIQTLLGQKEAAQKNIEQAIAHQNVLIAHHPNQLEIQHQLAASHISLGRVNQDPKEFQQAIDLLRPMKDKLPTCRFDLAQALNQLAIPLEPKLRETLHTEALEIANRSLADTPNDPSLQHLLGQVSHNMGLIYFLTGRHELAEQYIQKSLQVLETLVASHEGVFEYQNSLAECLSVSATIQFTQKNNDDGNRSMERSTTIRKLLVTRYPSLPNLQESLSRSYQTHAALLIQAGKFEAGESLARQGLAAAEQVNRTHPTAYNQSMVAASLTLLATSLNAQNREAPALEAFERSCEIQEQLVANHPEETSYQVEAGVTLMNFGNLLRTTSTERSLQYANRSVELLSNAYSQSKARTDWKSYLFNALGAQAQTLDHLQRYSEAAQSWARAIEHSESDPAMETFLLLSRAMSSVRAGELQAATEMGRLLAKKEKLDGATTYNVACIFCLLAQSSSSSESSKDHLSKAFELMHRPSTIEFLAQPEILELLMNDSDLSSFRVDPRFQELADKVLELRAGRSKKLK